MECSIKDVLLRIHGIKEKYGWKNYLELTPKIVANWFKYRYHNYKYEFDMKRDDQFPTGFLTQLIPFDHF